MHKFSPDRLQVVVLGQMRTAKCECGWPDKRDCFHNTSERKEWCWPCTVRWALRPDAASFVAPRNDVIQTRAVRRGGR